MPELQHDSDCASVGSSAPCDCCAQVRHDCRELLEDVERMRGHERHDVTIVADGLYCITCGGHILVYPVEERDD